MTPHVYLAVPTFDARLWMKTAHTIISAFRSKARVAFDAVGCSALCTNFNRLLCNALNHNARIMNGESQPTSDLYTHFAMLHADVAAMPDVTEAGTWLNSTWLDVLLREMKHHRLTALSAAVRIKHDGEVGETSTATEYDDGAIERHIHFTDGRAETLTSDQFVDTKPWLPGRKPRGLLINTGCMLLDLQRSFWSQGFAFDFGDSIAVDPESGELHATNDPEDWRMSRALQKAGERFGVTTKVRTLHFGAKEYAT